MKSENGTARAILSGIPKEEQSAISSFLVRETSPGTNRELKELARAGAADGTVLLAYAQTEGRGRMGRTFYSPADTGIYISFLFRPKHSLSDVLLYTPSAAVWTAEAIEHVFGKDCAIKWVNDVFVGGKKVAGILTEAETAGDGSLSYLILGIGVNLTPPKDGFPQELAGIAGAIEEAGADPRREAFCAELCRRVFAGVRRLPEAPPLAAYRSRCRFLFRPITVSRVGKDGMKAGEETRLAVGIDDRFRLITRDETGREEVHESGEIRIVPEAAGE